MIDVKQYEKILDAGLLLDHYYLLCDVRDGRPLLNRKRVQGFHNLLCKKGYIEDGILTELALKLIESHVLVADSAVKLAIKYAEAEVEEEDIEDFDYAEWVISLHKKCVARIVKATGKKQARPTIDGVTYSFLPNPTDLGSAILRAVKKYNLKDYDKIEKCILKFVDKCARTGRWMPLLNYYVIKEQKGRTTISKMVTDMDSMEDVDDEQDDNVVNI